jgi:hypothetical protein
MQQPLCATVEGDHAELISQIENRFRGDQALETVDKRRNLRRPFTSAVTIQPCDRHGRISAPPIEGQAMDLSLWGLQFATNKRLDAGQFLALGFPVRVQGKQQTVVMLSEVRHVQAKQPESWVVGCEFRETLCSNQDT